MKKFYLLRHQDVHGNSGTGVVAEGIIFDNGMAAMTWLTQYSTVTVFDKVSTVKKLHSHGGLTEIIVEGNRRDTAKFQKCMEIARENKSKLRKKEV